MAQRRPHTITHWPSPLRFPPPLVPGPQRPCCAPAAPPAAGCPPKPSFAASVATTRSPAGWRQPVLWSQTDRGHRIAQSGHMAALDTGVCGSTQVCAAGGRWTRRSHRPPPPQPSSTVGTLLKGRHDAQKQAPIPPVHSQSRHISTTHLRLSGHTTYQLSCRSKLRPCPHKVGTALSPSAPAASVARAKPQFGRV